MSSGRVSTARLTTSRLALLPQANASDGESAMASAREKQNRGLRNMKPPLLRRLQLKRAAFPAISEVNHKSDSQPYKEANPVHDRQARHEEQTGENRKNWRERSARRVERTMAIRFAIAQDEHAGGNQREREQRPDVGEVGESANVEQAGGDSHHEASDPGGKIWRQIASVDAAEDPRKEPVAGHGEPDARLADLEDEQGGDHAHQGTDKNH